MHKITFRSGNEKITLRDSSISEDFDKIRFVTAGDGPLEHWEVKKPKIVDIDGRKVKVDKDTGKLMTEIKL